jgi:hypothetical protein
MAFCSRRRGQTKARCRVVIQQPGTCARPERAFFRPYTYRLSAATPFQRLTTPFGVDMLCTIWCNSSHGFTEAFN